MQTSTSNFGSFTRISNKIKQYPTLLLTGLLIAVAIILPTFTVEAKTVFSTGLYIATKDINVRSKPQVGDNLINHFKKGQYVTVTRYIGNNWCAVNKVGKRYYKAAYVYCPNLRKVYSTTSKSPNTAAKSSTSTKSSNQTTFNSPEIPRGDLVKYGLIPQYRPGKTYNYNIYPQYTALPGNVNSFYPTNPNTIPPLNHEIAPGLLYKNKF